MINSTVNEQTKYISNNPLVKIANSRFLNSVSNLCKQIAENNILDCGCGEGIVMNHLKKKISRARFVGFDIDKTSVNLAKKLNPSSKISLGSIYKISQKENSFPLLLCMEVLEHLDEPEKALSEIKRVTSKYAIISVPCEPFFSLSNILRLKYLKSLGNTPGHINRWSIPSFRSLISKYFIIEKEVYPFPWMVFLVSKKRA